MRRSSSPSTTTSGAYKDGSIRRCKLVSVGKYSREVILTKKKPHTDGFGHRCDLDGSAPQLETRKVSRRDSLFETVHSVT